MIFEKALAKINIALDITGVRADGFHEIESVMQCVSFGDDVTLERAEEGITLECSDKTLPTDGKNLAVKAALAFFEHTGRPFGVHITVKKNIPDRAGLAGGSADAAAVLRGLNEMGEENLSDGTLREIAAGIGSDVVFCVSSDPSFVTGRGEIISPCEGLSDCFVLLAKGEDGMKTPEAYRMLDERYGDFGERRGASACREAMGSFDLAKIGSEASNIFESVVIPAHPEIAEIKEKMLLSGAIFAMMSGSGSAVFGVFDTKEKAEAARLSLEGIATFAVVAEPMN